MYLQLFGYLYVHATKVFPLAIKDIHWHILCILLTLWKSKQVAFLAAVVRKMNDEIPQLIPKVMAVFDLKAKLICLFTFSTIDETVK